MSADRLLSLFPVICHLSITFSKTIFYARCVSVCINKLFGGRDTFSESNTVIAELVICSGNNTRTRFVLRDIDPAQCIVTLFHSAL